MFLQLLKIRLILIAGLLIVLSFPVSAADLYGSDCNISTLQEYSNTNVTAHCNLTIEDGGTLKITNGSFRMNQSDNYQYKLTINSGGRLELSDGSFTGGDSAYEFYTYSTGTLIASNVSFTTYANLFLLGGAQSNWDNCTFTSGSWIWQIFGGTRTNISNTIIRYGFRVFPDGIANYSFSNFGVNTPLTAYGGSTDSDFYLDVRNVSFAYFGINPRGSATVWYYNVTNNDRGYYYGNVTNHFTNCTLGGDFQEFNVSTRNYFYGTNTLDLLSTTGNGTVNFYGNFSVTVSSLSSTANMNRYFPVNLTSSTTNLGVSDVNLSIYNGTAYMDSSNVTGSDGLTVINKTFNSLTYSSLFTITGNDSWTGNATFSFTNTTPLHVYSSYISPLDMTLLTPENGSVLNDSLVNFTYFVDAVGTIDNCTVYIENKSDDGANIRSVKTIGNLLGLCDNPFTTKIGDYVYGICGAFQDTAVNYTFKYNLLTNESTNTSQKPFITDREACAWNGTAYACAGGVGGGNYWNRTYIWNPVTDNMAETPVNLPSKLFRGKACSNGQIVWVMAGLDNSGAGQNKIYRWNLSDNSITTLGATLPNTGYSYALEYDLGINDERHFIIGGTNSTSTLDSIVLFNKTSQTAGVVATMPRALYGAVGFLTGDWIYYGDGLNKSPTFRSEWYRFNINNYSVENISGASNTPMGTAGYVWLGNGSGLMFGGAYTGYIVTDNVTRYDIYDLLTNTTSPVIGNVNMSVYRNLTAKADYYWYVKCSVNSITSTSGFSHFSVRVTTTTTTTTTTTLTTTTTTTTTTTIPTCVIAGNNPPCETVTLREVVDYINLWIQEEATLADVVRLINAWVGNSGT